MSIHYCLKNKSFIVSSRNYLDDYLNTCPKKIDMTISGKYLSEYPNFDIHTNQFDQYPSQQIIEKLGEEIKNKYSVSKSKHIIIGSGSNGLLHNLIKIYFSNGGNLVTPFYTFNQAEYAVSSLNGITKRVIMEAENINFENIKKSIDSNTKMIYICNPNNPTGIYIYSSVLLEKLKNISQTIPIIVDESSIEFSCSKSLIEYDLPKNVIVLRTFSKAYGLANLRVGFMVCNRDTLDVYRKKITVNEVSGLSCEIAIQALKSDKYLENINSIIYQRKFLEKQLNLLGINVYDSNSNTLMTSTTFEPKFITKLSKNDVSIVKVIDIDGKIHIRISVQNEDTNNEFINVLNKVLTKIGEQNENIVSN